MAATLPLRLIGSLLVLTVLSGCSTLELTPVTASPSHHYLPGKFVWHDLLTRDVMQSRAFYGDLFGWEFRQQGRYHVVLNGDRAIAGMVEVESKTEPPGVARWIGTLSVEDVATSVELIVKQGGKVHEGPLTLGERGLGALVSDAGGAQLVLLKAAGGDPLDRPIEANDWLWDELWTTQPRQSIEDYRSLVAYTDHEARDGYWILSAGSKWRAGVRELFNTSLEPRWVPVIRVYDPEQVQLRAETLGGRVLVSAGDNADQPDAALIADPGGALFMVQFWDGDAMQGGE